MLKNVKTKRWSKLENVWSEVSKAAVLLTNVINILFFKFSF